MPEQNNQKTLKKLKIWNFGLAIFLIVIASLIIYLWLAPEWVKDENILSSKTNGTFKIRILEEPMFFMQFRYRVQTAQADSAYWTTIYSVTRDDPFSINSSPIGFVNDETGYFSLQILYGVTKDKGKTWNFFDYLEEREWGKENGYVAEIDNIVMNETGQGTIYLKHFRMNKSTEVLPKLVTNDFGFTWKERF